VQTSSDSILAGARGTYRQKQGHAAIWKPTFPPSKLTLSKHVRHIDVAAALRVMAPNSARGHGEPVREYQGRWRWKERWRGRGWHRRRRTATAECLPQQYEIGSKLHPCRNSVNQSHDVVHQVPLVGWHRTAVGQMEDLSPTEAGGSRER
jgi:hypothetical protein